MLRNAAGGRHCPKIKIRRCEVDGFAARRPRWHETVFQGMSKLRGLAGPEDFLEDLKYAMDVRHVSYAFAVRGPCRRELSGFIARDRGELVSTEIGSAGRNQPGCERDAGRQDCYCGQKHD